MQKLSLFSVPSLTLYSVAILAALMYGLVVPTLSIFLSEELHVRPLLVGLFFVALALTSIVYVQTFALWRHETFDGRTLIAAGLVIGGCACISFAYVRIYSLVLLVAIVLLSLSFAAVAQILALAGDYSAQYLANNNQKKFKNSMRLCMASAWLMATPIGFFVLNFTSFEMYYIVMSGCFWALGVSAYIILPKAHLYGAAGNV
ncbi:MFS transporter [Teredinibacter purpureus]|uniref:hypothetical protein n=1 Tax=Teredinibacter purpureus TaxID=2731756 RepID=UPI0013C40FA7|nr:hypothetical protein [Teredinibacter purpureus]